MGQTESQRIQQFEIQEWLHVQAIYWSYMQVKTPGLTLKYYNLSNGFEKGEKLATFYDEYQAE